MQPSVAYSARRAYTFEDVVLVGVAIAAKKLSTTELKKVGEDGGPKYGVPYKSWMNKWGADDAKVMAGRSGGVKGGVNGSPHWLVERDVRRRTELTVPGGVKGGGSLLGKAEDLILVDAAKQFQRGTPYLEIEIKQILLNTAIELKLLNHKTKQPYDVDSDIEKLFEGFVDRAADRGVNFVLKNGRKLSVCRAKNACLSSLARYRDEVIGPALREFQEHGALTLQDVGNFDEYQLDLCDYANKGYFFCLKGMGCNVLTPFEQCPHITIITGFVGAKHLNVLVIIKGPEFVAPHPHNAQLLRGTKIYLATSPTGWVDTKLKLAFIRLQIDDARLAFGVNPCVLNFDGHSTNTKSEELSKLLQDAKILGICPPSHSSADLTQQCDKPASIGGPIAVEKAHVRRHMPQLFRAALARARKGVISTPEMLYIIEQAVEETWPDDSEASRKRADALNTDVGYFIGATGKLEWDLLPVLNRSQTMQAAAFGKKTAVDDAAGRGRSRPQSSRRAAIEVVQVGQATALVKVRGELQAAQKAVGMASAPVAPTPAIPVPRANPRSNSQYGLVVSSAQHRTQLQADALARHAAAAKKTSRVGAFWETAGRRTAITAAEARLASDGVQKLRSGELRSVIESRTGHCVKASSNKVADGESEGAMLLEARAAIAASATSLCPPAPAVLPPLPPLPPPLPPQPQGPWEQVLSGGSSSSGAGGSSSGATDDIEGLPPVCPHCAAQFEHITWDETDEDADVWIDAEQGIGGEAFCQHCNSAVGQYGMTYQHEGDYMHDDEWRQQQDWNAE